MSATCRTCMPPDCFEFEDSQLYSLESELFPFAFFCPPGSNCGNATGIRMDCCDRQISSNFPSGSTVDEKLAIIQQLASECARIQLSCGEGPSPSNPNPLFYNSQQCCNSFCPEGSPFNYCVAAGTYAASSQIASNGSAYRYACSLAIQRRVCLSNIRTPCCFKTPYSTRITAKGDFLAVPPKTNFWQLTDGSLPPGLTFHGGALTTPYAIIDGTPTTLGDYTFTVKITEPSGDSMSRIYHLSVCGAVNDDPLPAYSLGQAYFELIIPVTSSACGGEPVKWEIIAGELPDGLTLDENTGLISGTPTANAIDDYVFTIRITTEAS